jgi:hypothetical protein
MKLYHLKRPAQISPEGRGFVLRNLAIVLLFAGTWGAMHASVASIRQLVGIASISAGTAILGTLCWIGPHGT